MKNLISGLYFSKIVKFPLFSVLILAIVLLFSLYHIKDFRLDYAINEVYEFFWNKFCDVYIEECKKSGETDNLRPLLKEILIMMHPFAPFITEEIHSLLFDSPII